MKTPAGKIISPNGNLYNLFNTKSHKKEAIFSDVPHKENTLLTELSSFSKDANISDELLLSSRFHVEINNLQSSRFHVEINNRAVL